MPAQKLAGVTVDHQRERRPAVLTGPDPRQIRRPVARQGIATHRNVREGPLVRRGSDGRNGLDTRPHPDGALANLPALELKDPLHRVLVEAEQPRDCAVAEGRLGLDHDLDRLGEAGIDLRRRFAWCVVDRPPRHPEPGAELGDRHRDALRKKALLDALNHLSSAASSRACAFFRARISSMASP